MKSLFVFIGLLFSVYSYSQSEKTPFHIDGESFSDLTDLQDNRIAAEDELVLTVFGSDSTLLDRILGNFSHVTELTIIADSLQSLGHAWSDFQQLKRLELVCPLLKRLPDEIGDLRNLAGLEIEVSQLEALPASFSKLEKLDYIGIHTANFSEFPPEILALKNGLWSLDIDISKVKELPENFSSLSYKRLFEDDDLKGNMTLRNCSSLIGLPPNMRTLPFDVFLKEAKSLKDISGYNFGSQTATLMLTDLSSRKQVKRILRSLKNTKNLRLIIDSDFLLPFPRALKKLDGLESLHVMLEGKKIEEEKINELVRIMPNTQVIVN